MTSIIPNAVDIVRKTRSTEPSDSTSYKVPQVDPRDFHNADPEMISSEFCFYLKTIQSAVFRTLIDAMKEIVADTNLIFDEKGLLVKAIDESQHAMLHLRLSGDKFEEYICNGTYVCGVALINLHKLLKTMSSTDVLMIYQRKGEQNTLSIRVENNNKAKTATYKLFLLDLQKTNITSTTPEFKHAISIESTEFHKIVREMKDISTHMEIQCHEQTIRFLSVKGAFAEAAVHLGVDKTDRSNSVQIVQGIFDLRYLCMITKCTPLCRKVHLFMKNDYPLIIQYDVSNMGKCQLILMMSDV